MPEIEVWRAEVLLTIQKLRESAPPGYPARALLDRWEEEVKFARLEHQS